jgi:hypothetical protein
MRRSFEWPQTVGGEVTLLVYHDEDAEIYINGVAAATLKGFSADYISVPIAAEAMKTLKPGKNTLAVHCHQTGGGQGIDVGMVTISFPKGK